MSGRPPLVDYSSSSSESPSRPLSRTSSTASKKAAKKASKSRHATPAPGIKAESPAPSWNPSHLAPPSNEMQGLDISGNESDVSAVGQIKRNLDAYKGGDGKLHCNVAGCTEPIKSFNRPTDFNKHMDKHERPYKCMATGCEKLQGFTYTGGLSRHNREVHSAGGGGLMCGYSSCKRSTGKGFTRTENLKDHYRRLHNNIDPNAPGAAAPPGTPPPAGGEKRKRTNSSPDVEQQLRNSQQENALLKARIAELEARK